MRAARDDRSTPNMARRREMAHRPTTRSRTARRSGLESPIDRLVDQHRKKLVAAHPLVRESPNRAIRLSETAFRHREIQPRAFRPTRNCPAKNSAGTIPAAFVNERSRMKSRRSLDATERHVCGQFRFMVSKLEQYPFTPLAPI
jgi:hypothetical protein